MVSFKVNSTPRTATRSISFSSSTPSKSSSGLSALSSARSNSSSRYTSSVFRPAVTPVPTKTITFKTDTVTKVTPVSAGPSAEFVAAAASFNPSQPAAEVTKTISFKTETPAPSTNITVKEAASPSADFIAAASQFNPKQEAAEVDKTITFKTTTPSAPATSAELAAAVASFNPNQPAAPVDKTISFKTVGEVTNNTPTSNNSLLNAPALEAPKLSSDIQSTVESLMAAANKAAASVAKRLDNTWDFGTTQAQKTSVEDRIQTAYQKALNSSSPADSFNAILQPQLSSLSAIVNSAIDSITSKSTITKKQNDSELSAAISSIASIVANGLKTAKTTTSAENIREAANAAIDRVIDVQAASDATLNNDHSALMNAISNMVKNSNAAALDRKVDIEIGFNGVSSKAITEKGGAAMVGWKTTPSEVLKMILDKPNASIDVLGQDIYHAIYGDDNTDVSIHTMSERYSLITNALKPYANPDHTMNSGKAQAAIGNIQGRLVIQQARELTPEEAKAKQSEMEKQLASGGVQLSQPKKEKTEAEKQIAAQGGSTTQAAQQGEIISVDKSGKVTSTKTGEAGKVSTAESAKAGKEAEAKKSSSSSGDKKKTATTTTADKSKFSTLKSMSDVNPTQMYVSKSGNLYVGKDLTPQDLKNIVGFAPAGTPQAPGLGSGTVPSSTPSAAPAQEAPAKVATPATATKSSTLNLETIVSTLGKSIGKAALPESYKVISFTPAGFTNVKSSTGTSVKIDTDIYNELKKTGYSDVGIANGLASGKMGVTMDQKSGKLKLGYTAEDPANTVTEGGIFQVDPYMMITKSDGSTLKVPEWSYKKLQALGVSEKDMADIPQETINKMNTLNIGSQASNAGDLTGSLAGTTVEAALQLPGERKVDSGLFSEVPLTAAQKKQLEDQTPNPAEHPLDYLLSSAVQLGEQAYTGLVKPQYKYGYTLEPTVAGLLKINQIGSNLAKPGSTVKDVGTIEGLTQYETFTTVMQYADKETLNKIAKSNPRLILGASTDGAIQPIIESKMGDDYWSAIAKSMTDTEYEQFSKELNQSGDASAGSVLKSMLEGAGRAKLLGTSPNSNFLDMSEYEENQIGQLARELTIDPVTPYPTVNALLLPILAVGKTPITIAKSGTEAAKLGKAAETLTLVKLGDGGLTAMKNGEVLGKLTAKEGDTTGKIFEIAGRDGSKVELKIDGQTVKAIETVAPSVKSVTPATSAAVKTTTTPLSLNDFSSIVAAKFNPKGELKPVERTISFKSVATTAEPVSSSDLSAIAKVFEDKAAKEAASGGDVAKEASKGPASTVVTPEMVAEAKKAAEGAPEYKALTISDTGPLTDIGQGVFVDKNGSKYVKYKPDTYLAVADDYDPNVKGILAVQDVDEAGHASITRQITFEGDKFHVTYKNADGALKTVRIAAEDAGDYDKISQVLQLREDAAAAGIKIPEGASLDEINKMDIVVDSEGNVLTGTMAQAEKAKQDMEAELEAINSQLDSEKAPSGGGGGDSGGYSSGGSGGSDYTPTTTNTQDLTQWTANSDWGAEVRSMDGGKTWQVKDPETGTVYSTTDYEKLALDRIEARRSKYDSDTNTYKKQVWNTNTKQLDTLYQDSAGGWVSKADLDAERAAIAANNPQYVYSVDTSMNNARTRTLGTKVEYLDTDTGIWLDKDAYTALKGSAETPIWSSEGGYYYFKKADGNYEILNPYTNVRQTPDEYAAYLSAKNASSSAATQVTSSYVQPSELYSAYTPNLQSSYEAASAVVDSRAGGAEQVKSAWDTFVQTADYQHLIESGSEEDLQILAKAKNGESLTEKEIARAQYLRSKMSAEGQAALDAATGGDTSVALMSQSDFENLMRANADAIANMSDAEIKASGLTPEKELFVHQLKAEENMSKFFATNDFQGASNEAQEVIKAEIGYYAGEPSQISNLLNKFNAEKSTWNLQTTQFWDKTVESIKSSRNLLDDMPDWWKAENADFTAAELTMGKNKYSDLIVTVTRNPSQLTMESEYLKNLDSGVVIGGEDGWSACAHTFKSEDGWIVKSSDGTYSFIRKNDFVTNADEAMDAVKSPLEMYFWEKPENVTSNLRIPDDADGSQIVSVQPIDAMSMGESEWAGLTASGGLGKDITKDYVAINLVTPSGAKWTTIREADKAGSFKVGKYVDVIEQAPIDIAGKTGKDLQAMSPAEFRQFVSDNAFEIRNLSDDDLPYLLKYMDDTRIDIIDEIRAADVTPVVEIREAAETELKGATDLENEWRDTFKDMEDRDFRSAVANNMDDIEKTNLDNLDLTPKQRSIIEAEIRDRNFIRDVEKEFKVIDDNIAKARDSYRAGEMSAADYSDIVKKGIAQKQNIIEDVKDIQKAFDKRFNDVAPIECAISGGVSSAGGKVSSMVSKATSSAADALMLTDLSKIAIPAIAATAVTLGANQLYNPFAKEPEFTSSVQQSGFTLDPATGKWIAPKQQILAYTAASEAQLEGEDPNSDWYKAMQQRVNNQKAAYPDYFKDADGYQKELDYWKQQYAPVASNSTTSSSANLNLTSLNQVKPDGYYLTKSGNTIRGKEMANTDLPYIVRELTSEEVNGEF